MAEDRITLITSEGEKVEASINLKHISGLVHNILEDSGVGEEIPLDSVKISVLHKILEFGEHHSFQGIIIPKPIPSPNLADFLDNWDASFIENIAKD